MKSIRTVEQRSIYLVVGALSLICPTLMERTAQGQCERRWQLVSNTGPSPRALAAMAYDAGANVALMTGGSGVGGIIWHNDTWAWDGATWMLRDSGLRIHNGVEMAYDSRRSTAVMVKWPVTETYEWDGAGWQMGTSSRPEPIRDGFQMTFDAARNETLLYGGWANTDTWAWDGVEWSLRAADGPPPGPNGLVYDVARQVAVLYLSGGETWEWDGDIWQQVATTGPPPRDGAAMAYDSDRQVVLLFGGRNSSGIRFGDTWEWNGIEWRDLLLSGPSVRSHPAMTYDSRSRTMVLFGGFLESGKSGETWVLQCEPMPGDLNCDGDINASDIEPFIVALFDPGEYANRWPDCDINLGDINGDGSVNALDIEPFLELLFGP